MVSEMSADVAATQFTYTLESPSCLTYEQRKFYEENGFLLVRGLVSPEKLDRFKYVPLFALL